MKAVSAKYAEDLDLHALRVLDVLFRERSLTRAADLMIIAIPTPLSNSVSAQGNLASSREL